jgi:hypothetical protein
MRRIVTSSAAQRRDVQIKLQTDISSDIPQTNSGMVWMIARG